MTSFPSGDAGVIVYRTNSGRRTVKTGGPNKIRRPNGSPIPVNISTIVTEGIVIATNCHQEEKQRQAAKKFSHLPDARAIETLDPGELVGHNGDD